MAWRWLVNGLSGLVGMMLNAFTDPTAGKIDKEHFDKLGKLVRQLTELRNKLAERDQ